MIREILAMPELLRQDPAVIRDVLVMPDLVVAEENVTEQAEELLAIIDEIDKHYRKAQQFRQKLQAVSRGMKPKMHRTLRWSLARTMVRDLAPDPRHPVHFRHPPLTGQESARRGRASCVPSSAKSLACSGNWKRPPTAQAARRRCARN